METTFRNMPEPSPIARMAVTSLSAASRLSPIRIPTSTAIGRVIVSAVGIVNRKSWATLGRGALFLTTNSKMRAKSRMKITNVKINAPISACEVTSRRI